MACCRHRLLVALIKFGILVLNDFAHANLRQLLGHQLLIKQSALNRCLVLDEGGNHLIQVFLTDARGFLAFGFGKSLYLYLELPGLLIETDIALVRVVPAFAVVEAWRGYVLLMLWLELESRR